MKWAALIAALALAGPASAAPTVPVRTAEQRETLIELAKVLGQAHALHRVCAGPTDDTWRSRMARLIEVEAPGDAFKQRLTESFNAGFTDKALAGKDCKAAEAAETVAAKRGAELARRLGPTAP